MKKILLIIVLIVFTMNIYSQSSDKLLRYFDIPIMIDTTNTLLIPTRYNTDKLSSSKIGLRNRYYANILISPAENLESRKLFETDTYILPLRLTESKRYYDNYDYSYSKSIFTNWMFFLVKNNDFDKNRIINEKDPTILYVTDLFGTGLRRITNENENVVDYYVYEKQNLVMIKIQRDLTKDQKFTYKDKDYYFLFLDYKTLKVVKRLEMQEIVMHNKQ